MYFISNIELVGISINLVTEKSNGRVRYVVIIKKFLAYVFGCVKILKILKSTYTDRVKVKFSRTL